MCCAAGLHVAFTWSKISSPLTMPRRLSIVHGKMGLHTLESQGCRAVTSPGEIRSSCETLSSPHGFVYFLNSVLFANTHGSELEPCGVTVRPSRGLLVFQRYQGNIAARMSRTARQHHGALTSSSDRERRSCRAEAGGKELLGSGSELWTHRSREAG